LGVSRAKSVLKSIVLSSSIPVGMISLLIKRTPLFNLADSVIMQLEPIVTLESSALISAFSIMALPLPLILPFNLPPLSVVLSCKVTLVITPKPSFHYRTLSSS